MKRINQHFLLYTIIISSFFFLNMHAPISLNGDYSTIESEIPFTKAELTFDGQSSVMTLSNSAETIIGEITFLGYRLGDEALENGVVQINESGLNIESSNAKSYDIIVPNSSNEYGRNANQKNQYRNYLNEGVGVVLRLHYPKDIINGTSDFQWTPSGKTDMESPCPDSKELNSYNLGGDGTNNVSHYKEIDGNLKAIYVICSDGNYAVATMDKGNCVKSSCWE